MSFPHSLNYRDLGGIPTKDGVHEVRQHILARSGKLQHISVCDIRKKGVRHIIDLRTPTEIAEKPDVSIPSVTYHQAPLLEDSTIGITHETGSDPIAYIKKLRKQPEQLYKMMPDMGQLYHKMISTEYSLKILSQALNIIIKNIENDELTLFHCTAGKDRTGVLSMVILGILGVSKEDILNEFCRTNQHAFLSSLKKGILVFILTGSYSLAKVVYGAFMANPSYLEHIYDEIIATYGDFTSFAHNALNIPMQDIYSLREKALVKK